MDLEIETRKRPAPRGTAAYPRKRAVAACQTCRSRKTKCDNRRPSCSFCERAGATCIYSACDLSAYDPASLAILDRLEQLEDNLKAHISRSSSSLSLVSINSPDGTRNTPGVVDIEYGPEPTLVAHVRNSSDVEAPLLPNTIEHILAWPVFQGRFDGHAKLVQLIRASTPVEQPASVNFDLDISTCKHLLERFFEHILSKNPVCEENALRKIMNYACLNGIGWDADSCLILLVCALGSIASPDASQADWTMARSYFRAAQRRIGILTTCDDLIVPQCYFLTGVYFMYNLRPLEAWRMFAQAVVCIHPDGPGTESPGSYSLEECVYWSCWKSEVELRMNIQIPSFGVIGNRYPPHIPEPPVTDASHEPKWFYYLADISLRRLDINIRETVATILGRSTGTRRQHVELALAVPTLEEQLQDWIKSMPDVFDVYDPEESILQFILKGRLLDSYDVLYIPFLEGALAANPSNRDASTVLDSYARKALNCCVQRIPEQKAGFTVRHHGTWLMLRTCARSAFMILAARIAGRLDLLPERWQNVVVTAMSVLHAWKDESHDVADRLAIIRTLSVEAGVDIPI